MVYTAQSEIISHFLDINGIYSFSDDEIQFLKSIDVCYCRCKFLLCPNHRHKGAIYLFNQNIASNMTKPSEAASSVLQLERDCLRHSHLFGYCYPGGYLPGRTSHCNAENGLDCCKTGHEYPLLTTCGSTNTRPRLSNSFVEGGAGGGPSECDHSNNEMLVVLSTGW